ncbi:MAG TPA: ATP-binding protein, partial [Hyphomicrobiales bacterium]|nr:ATP-binding protein [Hyphomicrobiales bacterium]
GRIAVTAEADAGGGTGTVADDGRGFDLAGLARAAVVRGAVAAERAAALDPAATTALAFAPGVTTAPALTPLAGRGIGLDAVRSEIEALGGTVAVDTARGRGTTIALRLPRRDAAPARAA